MSTINHQVESDLRRAIGDNGQSRPARAGWGRHTTVTEAFRSGHHPHTGKLPDSRIILLMAIRTLVHVSDLHLGMHPDNTRAAEALRDTLLDDKVDHVVMTGDLTHGGRASELRSFTRIFAPLLEEGRLTLVPGDRDRLGDDVAAAIQSGPRVSTATAEGLHIVRFDSSAHHHRPGPAETCVTTEADLTAILEAVAAAPRDALVVLMMHHPLLPLLSEHAPERLLAWLGRDYHNELDRGQRLLAGLRGRCSLLLHGHAGLHGQAGPSQTATAAIDALAPQPLRVFNAGRLTDLGRVRVFWHEDGRLSSRPAWVGLVTPPSRAINRRPGIAGITGIGSLTAPARTLFAA